MLKKSNSRLNKRSFTVNSLSGSTTKTSKSKFVNSKQEAGKGSRAQKLGSRKFKVNRLNMGSSSQSDRAEPQLPQMEKETEEPKSHNWGNGSSLSQEFNIDNKIFMREQRYLAMMKNMRM